MIQEITILTAVKKNKLNNFYFNYNCMCWTDFLQNEDEQTRNEKT